MEYLMSKKFETHLCDFYDDNADEVWLTREQIGSALGYANPSESIRLIHNKHKERLDKFCVRSKIQTAEIGDSHEAYQNNTVREDGLNTSRPQNKNLQSEVVLYSQRGVMEICRWSDMPKADQFMDWVWDIVEGYRHKELVSLKKNLNELLDKYLVIDNRLEKMEKQITDTAALAQTLESGTILARSNDERWVTEQRENITKLAEAMSLEPKECIEKVIKELDESGRLDNLFQDYANVYRNNNPGCKVYRMAVLSSDEELMEAFEDTLHDFMVRYHLADPYDDSYLCKLRTHEAEHYVTHEPSNEELAAMYDDMERLNAKLDAQEAEKKKNKNGESKNNFQ